MNMKPLMARNSQDFSSKRHFHWTKKVGADEDDPEQERERDRAPHVVHVLQGEHEMRSSESRDQKSEPRPDRSSEKVVVTHDSVSPSPTAKKKLQAIAVSKLRSVLFQFAKNVRSHSPGGGGGGGSGGLGSRVVGTIFGRRRGHVLFSLQKDANSQPAFLVELATPISGLVREMASGLVRIALECDKPAQNNSSSNNSNSKRLLEEPVWRTYCNGKKCGFAARRDCGPKEWKVLKAVEPISMGAGVLPLDGEEEGGGGGGGVHESGGPSGGEGEMMYMRAKFERIVGSRDCEAFYMMNPDCNGTPELSVYLLRV